MELRNLLLSWLCEVTCTKWIQAAFPEVKMSGHWNSVFSTIQEPGISELLLSVKFVSQSPEELSQVWAEGQHLGEVNPWLVPKGENVAPVDPANSLAKVCYGKDGWVTFASRKIDLNHVWVGPLGWKRWEDKEVMIKLGYPNLTFSTCSSAHGLGKAKDSLQPFGDEFPQEWGRWKGQEILSLVKVK